MTQHDHAEQIAEFEAWSAANEGEQAVSAAAAAGILADLVARADRAGADLRDPTAELLRWLTRDLARDADVDLSGYERAVVTLTRYLLFLREAGRWRRSERAVQDCWDVLGWASRRPLGLVSLGGVVDATITKQLDSRPATGEFLATATSRAYVGPLRSTLDAAAAGSGLGRPEMAGLLRAGPADAVAADVWVRALVEADLLREDVATGVLTPTAEVGDAGGCPPPSTALLGRLISGLVRSALERAFQADVDDGVEGFPRGMATLVSLVDTTQETCLLGDDEQQEPTSAVVDGLVAQALRDPDDDRRPRLTADVLDTLAALQRLGLLDRAEAREAWVTPTALRHQVIRAVADFTGCVGTADQHVAWEPVELASRLPADAGLDLLISLEQAPVWRRVRVMTREPLTALHRTIQDALGWRDVRDHVFCDEAGVRRFAPRWLLRRLTSDADSAVIDAESVPIGAALTRTGDELIYLYGHLDNPWRLQVRVERVMSGVKEPALLDGAGEAPSEPTLLWQGLRPEAPGGGLSIPAELEQAWAFMESRRWFATGPTGSDLAAPGPPAARPGIVFNNGLTLDGWFETDSPAAARLQPVAASPDGTRVALWLDDGGATRVVGLGPDGEAFLMAGSAVDLLRLAAIGYPELSQHALQGSPPDPAAAAGIAEFRDWVRGYLGADVPDRWGPVGDDEFTGWVAAHAG